MDTRTFFAGAAVGAIVGSLAMFALRPDQAATHTGADSIPAAEVAAASIGSPPAPAGDRAQPAAPRAAVEAAPGADRRTVPVPVTGEPAGVVPPNTDDADLRALFDAWNDSPDMGQLNNQLKSEARDESWASNMETQLQDYLARRPAPNAIGTVSIECRMTLCRMVSVVSSTIFEAVPYTDLQAALNDLRNESLGRELSFSRTGVSVGSAEADQIMEVAFLRRAEPVSPD